MSTSVAQPPCLSVDAMLDWVKQREGGFRPTAYHSPEGSEDTIGYGHKLYKEAERAKWQHRTMTATEAEHQLRLDWTAAESVARHILETHHNYQYQWADFSPAAQLMLTDFAFNGTPAMLRRFPNFVHALHRGDMDTAQRECHRHYIDKHGVVRELKDRNVEFQKLFFQHPPIDCPTHAHDHKHTHTRTQQQHAPPPPAAALAASHQHTHPPTQPPSSSQPPPPPPPPPLSSSSSSSSSGPRLPIPGSAPSSASPRPGADPSARHAHSRPSESHPPAPSAAAPHQPSSADVDASVAAAAAAAAFDDDLPDFIADEFQAMDRRIESVTALTNLSLLDNSAHSHGGSYHLVDPSLRLSDHLSSPSQLMAGAAQVVPVFDLANQAEMALKSVGASMIADAGNLFFGTSQVKPTLNQVAAHLMTASSSVLAKSLVHNQLNDLLFGEGASRLETALLDTGASVALALAYGNAEAARKVAFESALNYAVHELGLPASYGHTTRSVGGTLIQSDHRILRGTVEQHSASYAPLPGVSVGVHFRTSHVLRQEGDYQVDRHSHSIGGQVSGLGLSDVSLGFGSRRDTSSVVQRAEGAQTVSTWFTRFEDGKFMADVRVANRVSDLEDLSLGQTLLLCATNPLMAPLAILSRLPALYSYRETHTVRANMDGTPMSITKGLPLSHLAGHYQPTALLTPLTPAARPLPIEQTSSMHRSVAEPLLQEARASVGRIETVDSTHHKHGEERHAGGVLGSSESDVYTNRGRIIEVTGSDSTVSVNGESITDLHTRTTTHSYIDATYMYEYRRSGFLGMSRSKVEQWFGVGEKRLDNKLPQTVDQQVRLRSNENGEAYSVARTDRDEADGSHLSRTENTRVIEEAARVTHNHALGSSSRDESITHHGDFEQSITSTSTRAVADTHHVIQTDNHDFSIGRFGDEVSRNGQQLPQHVRKYDQVDAHVVSKRETLHHVDPSQPLYAADVGQRTVAGVQGAARVTVYQQVKQQDEYKIGHPTLSSEWSNTAVGSLAVTTTLQQSQQVLTARGARWSGVKSIQSDTLTETASATFSSLLGQGSTTLQGAQSSATYALGTQDESLVPVEREVTASRTYLPTAAAGKIPPALYTQKVDVDNPQLRQVHHKISRVDEIHTAKYGLLRDATATTEAGQKAAGSEAGPSSSSSESTVVYQPVDSATLSAALSATVSADVLGGRGHTGVDEAQPTLSHVRLASGISIDRRLTNTDYNIKGNVLTEAHTIRVGAIVKQSELQSGTGSKAVNGEETVVKHDLLSVTRTEQVVAKGLLWDKVTVKSSVASVDAAGVEQPAVDSKPEGSLSSSAGVRGAASTAASYGTGLLVRHMAGGRVDGYDAADMGVATTRSLFQSHLMDSVNTAEHAVQRRAALSIERGALEQGRVSLKVKTAGAVGAVILASNVVRQGMRKVRQRDRAREKKRLAERRQQEAQAERTAGGWGTQPAAAAAAAAAEAPLAPVADPAAGSQESLVPTAQDVAIVAVTSAVDFTPVAVQLAVAGMKHGFLAASGASLAIDAVRTGWNLSSGAITKTQAAEQLVTSAVATLAGVGGAVAIELALTGLLGLAGLPLAIFVGVGTALITLGVQWVMTAVIDWRRKAALQTEYADLCGALGVAQKCTDGELTRAWRDASKLTHPDRAGGSHEQFVRLNLQHKRAIELRLQLDLSREREDGLRRNERMRMPTWIRWWLHVLTNLNGTMMHGQSGAAAATAPPIGAIHDMLDLYHPVSDRFTEWQRQQAVYAAELDE